MDAGDRLVIVSRATTQLVVVEEDVLSDGGGGGGGVDDDGSGGAEQEERGDKDDGDARPQSTHEEIEAGDRLVIVSRATTQLVVMEDVPPDGGEDVRCCDGGERDKGL